MAEYANRTDELDLIQNALNDDTFAIFLIAGKACGITSFLNDKFIPDISKKNIRSYYINVNNHGNLSSALLELIIKDTELYPIMQDCFNESYGEKNSLLVQSLAQDIPYIGNTISHFLNRKSATPLYTGNFTSAAEEIYTTFFNNVTDNNIVIIIDAAQNLIEESYAVINDLMHFNNIHFIFAITEQTDNYLKLKNFIMLKRFSYKEINFCAPQPSLVIELGKLFNRRIGFTQAQSIITTTKGNIHKIIEAIGNDHNEYHLNLWAKAIISILYICMCSIEKEELYNMIKLCHLYSPSPLKTFEKTLDELCNISIIIERDNQYELYSLNHPEVNELINSYTDQIVYKRIVLSYLKSTERTDRKVIQLLYNLSHELKDNQCKIFARYLIKYSLQDGSKIGDDIITSAELDNTVSNDCILSSIIYARQRNYKKALTWIEHANISEDVFLKGFYGILLNRTRNHTKAETILLEAIKQIENLEAKTILYSFLISNYIHQEQLSQARMLYFKAKSECSNTKSFGYLIRNATSAFKEQTLEMYNEALSALCNANDMFGYYSTLSNRGYALLSTNLENGKDDLEKACKHLILYGENITHIVNNDLGIAHMLQGDFQNAKYYFDKVIANEINDSMPKIFAMINLACCDALAGHAKLALKNIQRLQEVVEKSPLNRIRQKYYINRLLIEYLSGLPVDKNLIRKAKKYPDRYAPNKTAASIDFYMKNSKVINKTRLDKWRKLYSPCGLVYWFVNPLKIFPEGFLDKMIPIKA